MYLNSEGIVLRQRAATGGRKMILLFTKKYGKISAGTFDNVRKGKTSPALRPFTSGNYQIFQGKNYYNLDKADSVKTYYGLGEDLDKYMAASFALELTDKVVPEELPQPAVFDLLIEFLDELSGKKASADTLLLAFETRLLRILGSFPKFDGCVICGEKDGPFWFSVPDGGLICAGCAEKKHLKGEESLIFRINFDIVGVLNYYASKHMSSFRGVALESEAATQLKHILREYIAYHLDVAGLKSETVLEVSYGNHFGKDRTGEGQDRSDLQGSEGSSGED